MNLALERYKEQIIFNEAFRNSVVEELISNHSSGGTILLLANEIVFDQGFKFSRQLNGNDFPGLYDMIIVADRFDSRGGMIDLTGKDGGDAVGIPPKAAKGPSAHQEEPRGKIRPAGRGKTGDTGNMGGAGDNGMNIKVFCARLVSIQISSNGGIGGTGGKGGTGGDGGDGGTFEKIISTGPKVKIVEVTAEEGQAGKGGRGGPVGRGGNAGKIELFYCDQPTSDPVPSIRLVSNGGKDGKPGPGGDPGDGDKFSPFESGAEGGSMGPGSPSTPSINVVSSTELWERVSFELGLVP